MIENQNPFGDQKIIIGIASFKFGGAERQALYLARYLKYQKKADVEIWGIGAKDVMSDYCEEYGIKWRSIFFKKSKPRFRLITEVISFSKTLREHKVQVLISFTPYLGVLGGFVWRFSGLKACIWSQRDAGHNPKIRKTLMNLGLKMVTTISANSSSGALYLNKSFGIQQNSIIIIPNGTEDSEIEDPNSVDAHQIKQKFSIPADAFVAIMIANLSSVKNHKMLIKAWHYLCKNLVAEDKKPFVILAGRHDSEYEKLSLQVNQLKINEWVRIPGRVDNIKAVLRGCDLGILTSLSEGCPNAILEYMEAKLPIVGTNIPAIRDTVGPLNVPYLVSPNDFENLAIKVNDLCQNPQIREQIGNANKVHVNKNFSLQQMGERFSTLIYKSLEMK